MSRITRLGGLAAMLLAVVISGLTTSFAAARPRVHPAGTATFALAPTQTSRYIFPFTPGAYIDDVELFQMQNQLWLPLYWFGNNGEFYVNYKLSIAQPPVYSNGGRTVTIHLKHYLWSDGRPVTNRDVEFWMHIYQAERAQYYGYVAGDIPSNIQSMSFPSATPYTFSITFTQRFNPLSLLYNDLSEIFPIPQHVWDRVSSTGPVGNYDLTPKGAAQVFNYLNTQSQDKATWTTNPLWRVVDGPWRLQGFDPATGYTTLVPNARFTGPDRPHLAKVEEVPFTSDTAEFDALRAGQLDYGYLPAADLTQKSYFQSHGYSVVPWPEWGFASFWLNFTNPKAGAIFRQLYVRQAFQHVVDQPGIVRHVYHGDAYPSYGPVPLVPKSIYLTKYESSNPYPYSPEAARKLLASHGWKVRVNGVDTCAHPGQGPHQCGAGIARGARMSFTMQAASGSIEFTAELSVMRSDWSLAGIHLTIVLAPADSLLTDAVPCHRSTSVGCGWQMINLGAPGFTVTFSPQYLPTLGPWLYSNAVLNAGGYSSPTLDHIINETNVVPGPSAYLQEENFVSRELPWIWEPDFTYQLSVISNHLRGAVPQDPNLNIYPQDWVLKG